MTGVAYSLFAGQPLTILGSTGPVLVFEKILFKFCKWVLKHFYRHHPNIQYVFLQIPFDFFFTLGTMTCPICRWGLALACGRPCCVCSWLPRMQALWCATSPGSRRKRLPPSFVSSSSTKPWRNSSTWEKFTPSTHTVIWTNSRWHSQWHVVFCLLFSPSKPTW